MVDWSAVREKLALQQKSVQYVQENKEQIARSNQRMLLQLNVFFLLILCFYGVVANTEYEHMRIGHYYTRMILVQVVLTIVVFVRYWRPRAWEEIHFSGGAFQLYIMSFTVAISVFPKEYSAPALYFAPLALAFVMVFVFTWRASVILLMIEIIGFLFLSDMCKKPEDFLADLFSSVLVLVLALFCSYVLAQQRQLENQTRKQLREMGMMDRLTGIYNKAGTEFLCHGYLAEAKEQVHCALMIIDIDNFKDVNDTFGHQEGDAVLREVGTILKDIAGNTHIAGRIGGDEFLLLVKDYKNIAQVTDLAQHILQRTREILQDETVFQFSSSIGIAYTDGKEACSYDRLFSNADQALYQVKKNGKNQMMYFTEELHRDTIFYNLLIVDDQEVSRAVLRSCFASKYHIIEAENGKEAMAHLHQRSGEIAAILLDLEMPVMNGYEMLEELKKDDRFSSIPVLVITVHDKNNLNVLKCGAVDIITKPFDPVVVQKCVENAIRNGKI